MIEAYIQASWTACGWRTFGMDSYIKQDVCWGKPIQATASRASCPDGIGPAYQGQGWTGCVKLVLWKAADYCNLMKCVLWVICHCFISLCNFLYCCILYILYYFIICRTVSSTLNMKANSSASRSLTGLSCRSKKCSRWESQDQMVGVFRAQRHISWVLRTSLCVRSESQWYDMLSPVIYIYIHLVVLVLGIVVPLRPTNVNCRNIQEPWETTLEFDCFETLRIAKDAMRYWIFLISLQKALFSLASLLVMTCLLGIQLVGCRKLEIW